MRTRLFAALMFAALAAALSIGTWQVEQLREGDPPGATCYHFPLITVCCDAGGCYIL